MEDIISPRAHSPNAVLLWLLCGLAAGMSLPQMPALVTAELLILLALLLLWCLVHTRHSIPGYAAAFLIGMSYAIGCIHTLKAQRLPDEWSGSEWRVQGMVTGLPEQTDKGLRFDFEIERVLSGQALSLPSRKILLSYYFPRRDDDQVLSFEPGQRWQLALRLKAPRGLANEGAFDYEAWLLQQGYHAVGYIRSPESAKLLMATRCQIFQGSIAICFDRAAFYFLNWITRHVAEPHRALFAALTIGYGELFTREQWDLLKQTGTIHLVVVSGMHISLVAWVGYMVGIIAARIAFPCLHLLAAPKWGALVAILFAVVYAGLCGFNIPIQRSLVAVMLAFGVYWWKRQLALSTAFLLACTAILLMDPMALFSTSFWLSFGAVAVLLYGFSARHDYSGTGSWLGLFIKTQFVISFGMLPFLATGIGSFPLISPFANLIAVPYVTFLLLPLLGLILLAAILSPALAFCLLPLAEQGMDYFWRLLELASSFNKIVYFQAGIPGGQIVFLMALLAAVLCLAPAGAIWTGLRRYLLTLLLCLPLLVPWRKPPPYGEFDITLLDVGQGLSILIETNQHLSIYDVGDSFSDKFDLGRDLLASQVRRRGYREVDTLIISHGDSDHAGGLAGLLGELPARNILAGDVQAIAWRIPPGNLRIPGVRKCHRGLHWMQDGVSFRVISPPAEAASLKSNDLSCVLRISNGHSSTLLTGDIHKNMEFWLLAHTPLAWLDSDVLVVPHHGSNSSSSEAFLQAVSPTKALVSVGYQSRYGHPHPAVLLRYQQAGIGLWRSDISGAVSLSSRDGFAGVGEVRLSSGRFWHRW